MKEQKEKLPSIVVVAASEEVVVFIDDVSALGLPDFHDFRVGFVEERTSLSFHAFDPLAHSSEVALTHVEPRCVWLHQFTETKREIE